MVSLVNTQMGRLLQVKGAAGAKALWWAGFGTLRNATGAGLGELGEVWWAAGLERPPLGSHGTPRPPKP